jgi:hypothetical protein
VAQRSQQEGQLEADAAASSPWRPKHGLDGVAAPERSGSAADIRLARQARFDLARADPRLLDLVGSDQIGEAVAVLVLELPSDRIDWPRPVGSEGQPTHVRHVEAGRAEDGHGDVSVAIQVDQVLIAGRIDVDVDLDVGQGSRGRTCQQERQQDDLGIPHLHPPLPPRRDSPISGCSRGRAFWGSKDCAD